MSRPTVPKMRRDTPYPPPPHFRHTATHCNTLQHTATHLNTLYSTVKHCNTLQYTATRCNTLQVYRLKILHKLYLPIAAGPAATHST